MPDPVIIVDASGVEHEFPPGFDPKRAGEIVRTRTASAAPPATTERTWGDTARDVAVGFGKGAVRSAVGLADMAASSRMFPGMAPIPSAVVDKFTPEYTNTAQQVGGGLETAAELAGPAIGVARGVAGLARAGVNRFGPELMRAGTSDVGVLTQIRQAATRKLLGRVIDMAKEAPTAARSPNAGGRMVPGVGRNVDNVIADALEELRAPARAPGVELPPPAQLPAGYTPRTSAPAPRPAPAPAPAPAAAAPTPRPAATHGPKNYFLKPDGAPAPSPSTGKRPYFLRASEPAPAPTKGARRELTLDDLPESWRSRVGDVAPPSGIAGQDYAKAAADVLSETGVTAQQAILAVSKNPSLPPGVRLQLISALKKAGGIK